MNSIPVIIALGSNLGDSPALIRTALDRLAALSSRPLLRSSLWQSTPVDCPPGSAAFINAAAGLSPLPGETPESLLPKLQAIERAFGRRPKQILNEPRPLDLDLIVFADQVRTSPALTLPHPRAHLRRFVLEPLNEIAPELELVAGKSVRQLLGELRSEEVLVRLRR